MRHNWFALSCLLLGASAGAASAARAETRGYVISWFATATNIADFKASCPEDRNKGRIEWTIRDLISVGYTKEQAVNIIASAVDSVTLPIEIQNKIDTRALVNGKPASIYNYPDAVADPNIETVTGKYGFGFNLGGANPTSKFIDPETNEPVDNQLWRAVGCTESYRAVPPVMPYPEELAWNTMVDSAPGWSIRITGADLSKDGPITITLDRTTQHLERSANGDVMSDVSYIIDNSARSHSVLQGEIKNGVISIKPAFVRLEGEMPYYAEIALRNTHMRLKSNGENLVGYWGGYINWKAFAYMHTSRPPSGADSIGLYHALKKMADASPDPKTGQNQEISATFRMEAVPAYLTTPEGAVVATPGAIGLQNVASAGQ